MGSNRARLNARRLKLERPSKVTLTLGETGMGSTVIGGVDVSSLCYGIDIESRVGRSTKIVVHLRALPVEIEAMGIVEVSDHVVRIDIVVDWDPLRESRASAYDRLYEQAEKDIDAELDRVEAESGSSATGERTGAARDE